MHIRAEVGQYIKTHYGVLQVAEISLSKECYITTDGKKISFADVEWSDILS